MFVAGGLVDAGQVVRYKACYYKKRQPAAVCCGSGVSECALCACVLDLLLAISVSEWLGNRQRESIDDKYLHECFLSCP